MQSFTTALTTLTIMLNHHHSPLNAHRKRHSIYCSLLCFFSVQPLEEKHIKVYVKTEHIDSYIG